MTKQLFRMEWTTFIIKLFNGFSNIGEFDPSYGNMIYVRNTSYDETIVLDLVTPGDENIVSLSVVPNTPITLSDAVISRISSFANMRIKYSSYSCLLPVYIAADINIIEMSCDTSDAVIRYTTNNQNPTEQDTQYISPIEISGSKIVKARGFKDGMMASDIAELKVKPQNFRELVVPDIDITRISYGSECVFKIFNNSYYPSDAKLIINNEVYDNIERGYVDVDPSLNNVVVYASYNGNENFENHSDYLDVSVPEVESLQVWTPISNMKFGTGVIYSICYGNGKFVAVGSDGNGNGKGAYSTDGINWTAISDIVNDGYFSINSICYGNGKFVVVSSTGKGAYSTDGINWTSISDIKIDYEGTYINYSVHYVNDRFMIFADEAHASYSRDGISWTSINMGLTTNDDLRSVSYGNGKYVAIAKAPNDEVWLYSTNGINWTSDHADIFQRSSADISMCYADGKFVAVGGGVIGGQPSISYSTDGINWTYANVEEFSDSGGFNSICYGNGMFVAGAGSVMRGTPDYFGAYSTDGVNWTIISDMKINVDDIYSICYGNGMFVAVGSDGKGAYCTY